MRPAQRQRPPGLAGGRDHVGGVSQGEDVATYTDTGVGGSLGGQDRGAAPACTASSGSARHLAGHR